MVEADNGYRGEPASIDLPNECLGGVDDGFVAMWVQRRRKGLVCAQHETINRRFKHLIACLQFFDRAVVVLTQIGINFGEFVWELPFEYHTYKYKNY